MCSLHQPLQSYHHDETSQKSPFCPHDTHSSPTDIVNCVHWHSCSWLQKFSARVIKHKSSSGGSRGISDCVVKTSPTTDAVVRSPKRHSEVVSRKRKSHTLNSCEQLQNDDACRLDCEKQFRTNTDPRLQSSDDSSDFFSELNGACSETKNGTLCAGVVFDPVSSNKDSTADSMTGGHRSIRAVRQLEHAHLSTAVNHHEPCTSVDTVTCAEFTAETSSADTDSSCDSYTSIVSGPSYHLAPQVVFSFCLVTHSHVSARVF